MNYLLTNTNHRDVQRPTSADRMRRCRHRRAAGVVRVAIDLDAATVWRLVGGGWLAADRKKDATAVGTAVCAFMRQELGISEERSVPPVALQPREPSFAELLIAAWARRQAAQ